MPKVKEWVNQYKGGEPLCPNCGVDTLYPVALPRKWLKLMHDFWFEYATDHKVAMAKIRKKLRKSALTCDHANEVPRGVCPCPERCYCRGNTCRKVKPFKGAK